MGIKLGSITELATGLLGSYKIPYTTGAITRLLRLDTLADWVVQTATSFVPSGTGAISRTVQAKERDIISVKDFGAIGDGSTDDSAALLLAITAAGGKSLYAPNGTYIVGTELGFSIANTTMFGDGPGTIFKQKNSSNLTRVITTSANGITLRDFAIDGNSSNQSSGVGRGVHITGTAARNSCIRLSISSTRGPAIIASAASSGFDGFTLIQNCVITSGSDRGIHINNHDYVRVLGNEVSGTALECLYCNPGDFGVYANNRLGAPTTANSRSSYFLNSKYLTITGNQVDDSLDDSIGLSAMTNSSIVGNVITGATDGGIVISEASNNLTVTGNTINGSAVVGISAQTATGAMADITIQGNICKSNGIGILIDGGGSGSCRRVLIQGNVLTSSTTYGVQIIDDSDGVETTGNYFNANTTAAYSDTSSGTTNRVHRNRGYTTEASGTGTINNASTSATITHGLSITPLRADITITLGEDPTNTPGAIWIDTIGSTTFKVNCENDPGASNLDFSWKAMPI